MIGITGYMSGGKSYYAVEHMLSMMFKGHRVVTNISLCCQAVTSYLEIPCIFWKQLYYFLEETPQGYHHIAISDYSNYPCGSPRGSSTYEANMVYVYLDEVSSIFDSMVHASDGGIQAVATWARHTEKRGIRIYLIMQFASELHKRLRVHITEYVACTNSNTIKIPIVGWGLPRYLRGISIRSRYMSDGETQIGQASWVRLRPAIYNCYKTAQIVVGASELAPFIPIHIDYTSHKLAQSKRLFFLVLVLHLLTLFAFSLVWGLYYA